MIMIKSSVAENYNKYLNNFAANIRLILNFKLYKIINKSAS